MQRRQFLRSMATAILLTNSQTLSAAPSWWERFFQSDKSNNSQTLTTSEITGGLKEALRVGAENVIRTLGVEGGFFNNQAIKIALPEKLAPIRSTLARFGMADKFDELERQLNRAAEVATPKAKTLFITAIKNLSITDVQAIFKGEANAATQYLEDNTRVDLALAMSPLVDESLAEVGAVKSYDAVMKRYNTLPFVPKIDANITQYVVARGMDGIFLMLGKEEAEIRKNPLKQTTQLLKKVFAA